MVGCHDEVYWDLWKLLLRTIPKYGARTILVNKSQLFIVWIQPTLYPFLCNLTPLAGFRQGKHSKPRSLPPYISNRIFLGENVSFKTFLPVLRTFKARSQQTHFPECMCTCMLLIINYVIQMLPLLKNMWTEPQHQGWHLHLCFPK
jgi:hypothetical protein